MYKFLGITIMVLAVVLSVTITSAFNFTTFEGMITGVIIGALGGKLGAEIYFYDSV